MKKTRLYEFFSDGYLNNLDETASDLAAAECEFIDDYARYQRFYGIWLSELEKVLMELVEEELVLRDDIKLDQIKLRFSYQEFIKYLKEKYNPIMVMGEEADPI